jgi:hypothetical protein
MHVRTIEKERAHAVVISKIGVTIKAFRARRRRRRSLTGMGKNGRVGK